MRSILEVSTIDFKFEVEGRNLLANTWVSSPHFLLHIAPTYPIFNWSYKPLIKHSSPYPIFCRILVGEIFIFAGYDPIYCNYMSWVKHGKTLCGSEAWLEVITPRDHMSLLGFIQLRISKDANFFLPIEYLVYIHILKKGGLQVQHFSVAGFPFFLWIPGLLDLYSPELSAKRHKLLRPQKGQRWNGSWNAWCGSPWSYHIVGGMGSMICSLFHFKKKPCLSRQDGLNPDVWTLSADLGSWQPAGTASFLCQT